MATSVNYKVPPVFTTQKPYSRWIDEIKAWQALTDLDKKKRGTAIASSLPEEGHNSIRDKVFSELTVDVLNAADGVEKLILFMDKIFKKDELSEAYEVYTEFDRFRRSKVTSMDDYVIEFEKLSNKTKEFKMELAQHVLAFKLLEYSELDMKDRQLALTGVDYAVVEILPLWKKSLDNRLPRVKKWLMVVVLKLNQGALLLKVLIIQEIVQEEIQVTEEIGEAIEDVITGQMVEQQIEATIEEVTTGNVVISMTGQVATSVVEQQVEATLGEVTTGNMVIAMTNQNGQAQLTSLSILMDLMVNLSVVLVVIQ